MLTCRELLQSCSDIKNEVPENGDGLVIKALNLIRREIINVVKEEYISLPGDKKTSIQETEITTKMLLSIKFNVERTVMDQDICYLFLMTLTIQDLECISRLGESLLTLPAEKARQLIAADPHFKSLAPDSPMGMLRDAILNGTNTRTAMKKAVLASNSPIIEVTRPKTVVEIMRKFEALIYLQLLKTNKKDLPVIGDYSSLPN